MIVEISAIIIQKKTKERRIPISSSTRQFNWTTIYFVTAAVNFDFETLIFLFG